jgi:hypothetical protein
MEKVENHGLRCLGEHQSDSTGGCRFPGSYPGLEAAVCSNSFLFYKINSSLPMCEAASRLQVPSDSWLTSIT